MRAAIIILGALAFAATLALMLRVSLDQSAILGILQEKEMPANVRLTMQTTTTTFWYEEDGVCLSQDVTTTKEPDESIPEWMARHNSAVDEAKKGKNVKNPPK